MKGDVSLSLLEVKLKRNYWNYLERLEENGVRIVERWIVYEDDNIYLWFCF